MFISTIVYSYKIRSLWKAGTLNVYRENLYIRYNDRKKCCNNVRIRIHKFFYIYKYTNTQTLRLLRQLRH